MSIERVSVAALMSGRSTPRAIRARGPGLRSNGVQSDFERSAYAALAAARPRLTLLAGGPSRCSLALSPLQRYMPPAVDVDRVAGNVGRLGEKKIDGLGDILGRSFALERCV